MMQLKNIWTPMKQAIDKCAKESNSRIRNQTIGSLNTFKDQIEDIPDRINQLNSEWDLDKVTEMKAASVIIGSTFLGFISCKMWFLVSGAAGVFLIQHALEGNCPTKEILRKMGVRTKEEIYNEKMVLKFLKGDFVEDTSDIVKLLQTVEK